jgi:hypothetical protein
MSGPFGSNQFFGSAVADAYTPRGSIVLNGSDETLKDASSTAGNRRTFTISMWIKKSNIDVDFQVLAGASDRNTFTDAIGIGAQGGGGTNDVFYMYVGGNTLSTSAVFRDPTAWYHVLWAIDTTQPSDNSRVRVFVNGVNYDLSGTQPSVNLETNFNRSASDYTHSSPAGGMYVGSNYAYSGYFDGYISEYALVDGLAYMPSAFGS